MIGNGDPNRLLITNYGVIMIVGSMTISLLTEFNQAVLLRGYQGAADAFSVTAGSSPAFAHGDLRPEAQVCE